MNTNELTNPREYHEFMRGSVDVDWTDSRLHRVHRLRLLSDPGFPFWDVSYCHGTLKDGTPCSVRLPFSQVPKGNVTRFLVAEAKAAGVYAKGLGLLDNLSCLS